MGWVGPRADFDGCGKSRPNGIWSPDLPNRSESLYRLSYPGPPPIEYIIVKFSLFASQRQIGERRYGSTQPLPPLKLKWTASRPSRFIHVEWTAVMIRLRTGCSGFEYLQGQGIFLFLWISRQPPMQEVPWVMQPGCEGCLLTGEM